MKKSIFIPILSTIAIIGALTILTSTKFKDSPSNESSEHIIIKYTPNVPSLCSSQEIFVFYGGERNEKFDLKKEKYQHGTTAYVVDLLNKYSQDGYSLISTTTFNYVSMGTGERICSEIHCYLKKIK